MPLLFNSTVLYTTNKVFPVRTPERYKENNVCMQLWEKYVELQKPIKDEIHIFF